MLAGKELLKFSLNSYHLCCLKIHAFVGTPKIILVFSINRLNSKRSYRKERNLRFSGL